MRKPARLRQGQKQIDQPVHRFLPLERRVSFGRAKDAKTFDPRMILSETDPISGHALVGKKRLSADLVPGRRGIL
jgi:hypothetical protein